MRPRLTKLASDLIWTHGAFLVMAISGLLLNLIVGVVFGAEGLGVFSQALAAYVIVSQISVGGVHLAVFRSVASLDGGTEPADIVVSGMVVAFIWGLAGAFALYFAAPSLGSLFQSEPVGNSIAFISLSLPIAAVNKVLISVFNAQGRMREYGLAQSLRYLVLLGFVATAAAAGCEIATISLCFLSAELAVAAYLVTHSAQRRFYNSLALANIPRVKELAAFGARGMGSGLAAELNIRTDIVMIGLLMSDRAAGAYALASVVYEGVLNAAYAVRTIINPALVRIARDADWRALDRLLVNALAVMNPVALLCLLVSMLAYRPAVEFVFSDAALVDGYFPLMILLCPLALVGGFLATDQILLQSGHPAKYTVVLFLAFGLNIAANLALVPRFGLEGAALATAASLLVATISNLVIFAVSEKWRPSWLNFGRSRGQV